MQKIGTSSIAWVSSEKEIGTLSIRYPTVQWNRRDALLGGKRHRELSECLVGRSIGAIPQ